MIYFFYLFKSFYLIKLSLNRIEILTYDTIYEYVPSIFKNIPSIRELDISNNKYDSGMLTGKVFEDIRLALPKKLMSLKLFNSNISISQRTFDHIKETFGLVIDLENNYPKIDILSYLYDKNSIFLNNSFDLSYENSNSSIIYIDDDELDDDSYHSNF